MAIVVVTSPGPLTSDASTYIVEPGTTIKTTGPGDDALALQDADETHLIVYGKLKVASADGITVDGFSSDDVITLASTARLIAGGTGAELDGDNNSLQNHGRIHAGSYGVSLLNANTELTNAGRIVGLDGVYALGGLSSIETSGLLKGSVVGADIEGYGNILTNTGKIVGGVNGVVMGDNGHVENSGRIVGHGGVAIDCTVGSQYVVNSGVIRGNVKLHGGALDAFVNEKGGHVVGKVFGGGGLDGMLGGRGDDVFNGGAGDDQLFGGGGDDTLIGGADDDRLRGDSGADTLDAGTGDNKLDGGRGRDRLDAGNGADRFIYHAFNNGHDRIGHFDDMLDMIDVSALAIAPGKQASFVAHAVTSQHGNAVIDLGEAPHHVASGIIVIRHAAHQIDADDFIFL